MKNRLFWTSAFLIAVCSAWLGPFYYILRYGTHIVQEPNLVILLLEIGLFTSLIVFAITNVIKAAKSKP